MDRLRNSTLSNSCSLLYWIINDWILYWCLRAFLWLFCLDWVYILDQFFAYFSLYHLFTLLIRFLFFQKWWSCSPSSLNYWLFGRFNLLSFYSRPWLNCLFNFFNRLDIFCWINPAYRIVVLRNFSILFFFDDSTALLFCHFRTLLNFIAGTLSRIFMDMDGCVLFRIVYTPFVADCCFGVLQRRAFLFFYCAYLNVLLCFGYQFTFLLIYGFERL